MFSFFKRSNQNGHPINNATSEVSRPATVQAPIPEIAEDVFIERVPSTPHRPAGRFAEGGEATPIVNDHTIASLFAFLDRNHETRGFDDALLNPDSSHLTQNLEALKNELVRMINKVRTFYEDFIQETEYHILSRSRSGMVDTVEELEMKKKIALGHLERIKEIQSDMKRDEGDCNGILISYTRGFRNGLAAISHHQILTKKF